MAKDETILRYVSLHLLLLMLLLLLLCVMMYNITSPVCSVRTPQNESLLLLAIRHKLETVADKLCEMLGTDISAISADDNSGNTPLWVALRSRQESIASKLVRFGTSSLIFLILKIFYYYYF